MAAAPSPVATLQLRVLGGAMAGVPADATAFAHRGATLMPVIIDPFGDIAELPIHEAWVGSMHELVARDSTGVYVNFLHRVGDDRIRAAYPGDTYRRLQALKRTWDPTKPLSQQPEHQALTSVLPSLGAPRPSATARRPWALRSAS